MTQSRQWSYTSFVTHLNTAMPSWYNAHLAPDNWFMEWLVACAHQDTCLRPNRKRMILCGPTTAVLPIIRGLRKQETVLTPHKTQDTSVSRADRGHALSKRTCAVIGLGRFGAGSRDEYNEIAGRWGRRRGPQQTSPNTFMRIVTKLDALDSLPNRFQRYAI